MRACAMLRTQLDVQPRCMKLTHALGRGRQEAAQEAEAGSTQAPAEAYKDYNTAMYCIVNAGSVERRR